MNQSVSWQYQFLKAYPEPGITARFKTVPEDFIVTEILPFELEDAGEHSWLYIEKRASNTEWVARQLARHAQVPLKQVSYAGLKDRQSIARQWFSVHLPGKDGPDWSSLDNAEFRILEQRRHRKKLQRGALKSNHFQIVLRELAYSDGRSVDSAVVEQLAERCELIRRSGVPNYFGEQRFGKNLSNMDRALAMFQTPAKRLPRHKRSLYLSAARSWLFNSVLSSRIEQQNWDQRLEGDVFMLDGKRACFTDDGSDSLDDRLKSGEIHPTAPLWGQGDCMSAGACEVLEQKVIAEHQTLAEGLVAARLECQRRATRLLPSAMSWQADADIFRIDLTLSAGQYATTVLRELVDLHQPQTC